MNATFSSGIARRIRLLSLLALLGLLAPATRAAAETNLNSEMAELAKSVKQFLDGKNETAVAVGQYTGPPDLPASSGPAIAAALGAELKKLGVDVKVRGTNFIINGKYKLVEDAANNDGLHAVAIETVIVNRKGEEVVGLGQLKPRGVYGDAAKAVILGLTYSLPPADDDKARDQKVKDSAENPKVYLDKQGKTRINAGDSPYAVEILVKEGDKFVPRAAVEKDGLAFVELRKDQVYRVRVINDAEYETAVELSIDGLNMFQFSEVRDPKDKDKPLYDRLLVSKTSSYDIPGWHRTNDKNGSDEFLVTKYADSEAAKLYANSANIGTITVTFAAAWPKDQEPPADEPKDPSKFSRSADLGTKRGAQTGAGYKEVERRFGVIRAAVSVRYSK